jgi:hypothetical protein
MVAGWQCPGSCQLWQDIPDKTIIDPYHVVNLKSVHRKSKITTVKPWDSREKEDLDGIIYTRVQQFLKWRKESQDIDIRLEALLHPR